MFKKINDILAGIPMTVVGGVSLLISLALELSGIHVSPDPAWIAVFVSGIPLLYLSVWRIIHNPGMKKISSALLITIAMFAAIAIGDLFAAGEVAFIMAIGAILEEKTTERARRGLRKLLNLVPRQGRRLVDGREESIPADQIRIDDVLRILPGESVPVDGRILSGNTSLNQAIITGESLPVDKGVGDEVLCGTLNCFGAIDIVATRVGRDSSLQKLIRIVRDAENNKAPMERIADVWATWLVPVALLIAIVTGLATDNIVRAVTVLVVFCPCALVLATPTAVMAAIGQATRHGVIIKSGEALERMGKTDIVAFDKTGTLTHGNLTVSDILPFDPAMTAEDLLRTTASVEALSEHPLARAIVERSRQDGLDPLPVSDFSMLPGKGVSATLGGDTILCGNARWLAQLQVDFDPQVSSALESLRNQGKAAIIVARNRQVVGVIALSDTLREEAAGMVQKLKDIGTDVLLLTGDHGRTAEHLARQVGISRVHAELLPEQKVQEIQDLQAGGHSVCMIGDGVNDAPALKIASVGVAMGTRGSDIAVDAADIALIGDDIGKIPYLKRLSNAAVWTIKFSISLSLVINFVAITLSTQGLLTPTTGALVHNAGSVLVVLIAALLYDRKFD